MNLCRALKKSLQFCFFSPSVSQSSCFSRAVEVDVLPLTKEVAEPAEGVTSGKCMYIRISKDV